MSYINIFLEKLKDKGVVVLLKEDKSLQIKAKKGAMNADIISELKSLKEEIVEFLDTGVGREYICSFQQERLCFLDKFEEGETQAYNMPSLLLLEGELNIQALEESLQTIISRHEVLRSNFIEIDAVFHQAVGSSSRFRLEKRSVDESQIEEIVDSILLEPFDLEEDLLFRAILFEVSKNRYYLFINMHHIVCDGWSVAVLIDEFVQLYSNHTPPPLKIQYGDYAKWQRDYLKDKELTKKLDFWIEELKGVEVLELPTTYPRPATQSYQGKRVSFNIDADTTQKLNALTQKHGATLFMTLLSSFSLLLHRYSGEDDIVVGSPIANRNNSEIENLIGFFVNSLPIRTDFSRDITFMELLSETKKRVLNIYEHQDVPFEKIVESLNITRDTSHSPLFQVMFVLQNTQQRSLELPNLRLEFAKLNNETSKFDLTMELMEKEGQIEGILEYATDLFSAVFMERFIGHFEVLLKEIVDNEHKKLSEYNILTPQESHELLVELNSTQTPYPREKSVHQIFEEQAEKYPNKIALVHKEQSLTYRELNEKSNQLAHYLIEKGLKKGNIVALLLDRSIEIIVGILGIIKAGGVYLPIDTSYPKDRIEYITTDSNAFLVLEEEDIQQALEEIQLLENPQKGIKGDDLVYLIYTSGSTGNPKGVMVEHHSVNRLILEQNYIPFNEDIVMLQSNSISFDVATFDIYGALLVGGTLVLYPESKLDLTVLNDNIEKYNINTMWLTSALFEQWVFALNEELDSLRYILAGGDVVNPYAVNQLHQKLPNITIIDGYGPTENTTFTTIYRCNRDREYSDIPIGRPINNTTAYILDKNLNLVPKGIIGELYTGGDGVARGYLNQDELSHERFFDFRDDRVYKTGDLVKYREDGNIVYLGREDNQVKIRGFRVELGEIEQQILQIKGIKECVVLSKENRLIAYITTENNQEITSNEIKNELSHHLPEYMIPFAINSLEQMPVNPNGKVDRRALAKLEIAISSTEEFVAPKDRVERALAKIFEEILKIERVGVYDNFFELGGHSLLATKLVAHIRTELMVEVPLKTLFASPTIKGLKESIGSIKVTPNLPKIVKRERESDITLSFAQERLWFLDKFEEGKMEAYNMPVLLKLTGRLDKKALEESLETIIARHEILRTNFIEKEMLPYQVIKNHQFKLETIQTTQSDIFKIVKSKLLEGFDLEHDLLFSATLFDLGEDNYYLFVNMHHIVSDGWSIDILVKEFIRLYQAHIENRHHLLTPLEIQYADYALWQRDYLKDKVLEEKLNYYRDNLAGIEPLNLPTQYPRPLNPSYRGDRVKFKINRDIATELNYLSQSHKSTLFMTLLSAFALLMQRYSGQEDIVVGSPVANRVQSEVEDLIGFFVNLLPFRIKLEDSSFISLLNQVKTTTLEGYEHQDIPFEKIVEGLNIPRDTSISPIFQVMFILQNNEQTALELPNLTLEPIEFENPTSKFDITMELNEIDGELEGVLEYATDLFSREFIDGMIESFKTLLFEIVKNENRNLSEYKIISESKAIATKKVEFSNKTLHQLIEEQVKKTPNKTAIVFEDKTLTYQELNQKSNQLAHYLIENGLEIEDIVALKLDRSLEMIIGILGILKAGGAYLPIDTNYPQDRINYILENSKAKKVLTQKNIKEIVGLAVGLASANQINNQNPNRDIPTKSLAYIIYTSGSTGNPKGVMVEHQGVVNRLEWQIKELKIDSSDNILQKTPFSFDVSVWELLLPLMCGAKEVIAKPNGHKDSNYLAEIIKKEQITTIHFVPSMLSVIYSEPSFIQNSHYLKRVVCSGEALPLNLVKEYYTLHQTPIYNLYGPTEASIDVTTFLCPRDTKNLTTIPIGKAIDNIELHILDKNLNYLPKGVVGELYIEGVGVARGYLNNPELTKKSFIERNGKILYKTGDLVKYLPDNNIDYIGRVDNQVKLRGLRIELGEIEQQLLKIEAIKESIVVIKEDNLVAYITIKEPIELSTIKEQLSKNLTEYMIPNHIEIIETMPLTPNGKADRKALLKLPLNIESTQKFIAPRDEIEKKLAQLFIELLGVEKVGIYDNFFELGGHSLLATQLVSKIRAELEVELSLKKLFATPTVESIKTTLSKSQKSSHTPIPKATNRDNIPLSYTQERLWFLDRFEEGESQVYSMPSLLRLEGSLDFDHLEGIFGAIVKRHEILRTNFTDRQVINSADSFKIDTIDISQNEIKESVKELLSKPFDLAKDSLFRVTLFTIDENLNYLFINMHHIISDGWSIDILIEEFLKLYNNQELKPLEIQYGDFALWQRDYLSGELLNMKLDYWRESLQGVEPLKLPTTYPRPPIQSYRGDRVIFDIDLEITSKLNTLSQEQGVTLFMTLISAFGLLLNRYTSQDDIVIGSPIANRNRVELEKLIGFFVNSLPFRINIDNQADFSELLKTNKETILNGYEHQDIPFEKIVDSLNLPRDTSHSPLFQVMFVLQNTKQTQLKLPDIAIDMVEFENPTSKFDLTMELTERDGRLEGVLEYATDLFSREFIESMCGHFKNLLREITDTQKQKLCSYNILTKAEEEELLVGLNQTQVDYPRDKTAVELFEETVIAYPHKVAVVYEDEQLTYKELNEKSNQLAHYLISKGVEIESVVALSMDRSLEMIIAILGVLKAGGVYLSLDSNYPQERLDYMIEDSKALLILTQEIVKDAINIEKNRDNLGLKITPNNLAYILYTSGSTGRPKGVMGIHRNIIRLIKGQEYVDFNENIRVLQVASVSFDAFTFDAYSALLSGGVLFLYPDNHLDLNQLNKLIKKHQINTLFLTAVLFEQWAYLTKEELPSLRYLLTGGERVNPKAVNIINRKFPKIHILDVYGPTENTTFTTIYTCRKDKIYNNLPVGKPIKNTTVYILDKYLEPVPKGVVGELYTGGDGVARGYLNLPELTTERFIEFKGERVYKTGDLVKYDEDNFVQYIGRTDNQIKLRGYRIELDAIEKVLSKMDKVKESAVIFRDKMIVAYIVGNPTNPKEQLAQTLPEYMIPTIIEQLESMPITSNGKIDKKTLSQRAIKFETTNFVAPRDKTEEKLAQIFKETLGIEKVGIYDNFFEIGGNSILSIQVVNLAKRANINIEVKDIFVAPTIDKLSQHLKDGAKEDRVISIEEAFLEDNIQPLKSPIVIDKNILLTGATGFLGVYILSELLKTQENHIYCLVRAKSQKEGKERVKDTMREYNLLIDDFDNRVEIVVGDLAQPNLGIDQEIYKKLSKTITHIYHSASYLNSMVSYEILKEVNVGGVKEVLKFASTSIPKKIEYISTADVFSHKSQPIATEQTPLSAQIHYSSNGYASSKFIAEAVLHLAKERGFDINIYRVGLITGDTKIGKNEKSQWFYNLIDSIRKIDCMIDINDFEISITPVDYIAKSILLLSANYNNDIFHLSSPLMVKFADLVRFQNIDIVDLYTFIQKVKAYNATNEKELYITQFMNEMLEFSKEEAIEYEKVWLKMAEKKPLLSTFDTTKKLDIEFPLIGDELLGKYFMG